MNKIDKFLDIISSETEDKLLYPTDLKDAIIGSADHFTLGTFLLLDKEKCIRLLCEQGLSLEEAIEHFDYNIVGSYMDGIPAYATLIDSVIESTNETLMKQTISKMKRYIIENCNNAESFIFSLGLDHDEHFG